MRAAAVDDVARTRELVRMAAALEAAGCQPIVFKGAALAHTHYRQPWLRPRLDVDVLVAERGQERASRALRDLGYERPPFVSGRLVMYQEPFVRAEAGGLEHVVDLHWRVANPQAVSRVLSHAELAARSSCDCRAGRPSARALSGGRARPCQRPPRGASPGRAGPAVAVRHPPGGEPPVGGRVAHRPWHRTCGQRQGVVRARAGARGESLRHDCPDVRNRRSRRRRVRRAVGRIPARGPDAGGPAAPATCARSVSPTGPGCCSRSWRRPGPTCARCTATPGGCRGSTSGVSRRGLGSGCARCGAPADDETRVA